MSAPKARPGDLSTFYACQCLNVQLTGDTLPTPAVSSTDKAYDSLFVGETGIHIVYVRAAVRTKSSEWTYVTCLLCGILVYRVGADPDAGPEIRQGPPSTIEPYILQTITGWVEVKRTCNQQQPMAQLAKSQEFSSALGVRISDDAKILRHNPPRTAAKLAELPIKTPLLPDLPQFLPAPPFTPANPTYQQFAARATEISAQKRQNAESRVENFVKNELETLDKDENRLRTEIESLWAIYRKGFERFLKPVTEDESSSVRVSNKDSKNAIAKDAFHPVVVPIRNASIFTGASGISKSFSETGMHFRPPPVPETARPPSPSPSPEEPLSASYGNASALRDQAVSLRLYESELKEAKARAQERQSGSSQAPGVKQPIRRNSIQSVPTASAFRRSSKDQEDGDKKGKRKVTFNAEPQVVTISRVKGGESESESDRNKENANGQEPLFDLDDLHDGSPSLFVLSTAPALIPSKAPKKKRRAASPFSVGSPGSFRSRFTQLRPGSLPTYSDSIPTRLQAFTESTELRDKGRSRTAAISMLTDKERSLTPENDASDEADSENEDQDEVPLVATSAPIATNPIWRAGRNGARSFRPMESLNETGGLPDWPGMDDSSPGLARTFSEHVENVLERAANGGQPLSQDETRRRLYNRADQVRKIDPGVDLEGGRDDNSVSDGEGEIDNESGPKQTGYKARRKAKRILDIAQMAEKRLSQSGCSPGD